MPRLPGITFRYRDRRISGYGEGRYSYTVDWTDPFKYGGPVPVFLCVIEGKAKDWLVRMPNPDHNLGPFNTRRDAAYAYLDYSMTPTNKAGQAEVAAAWQRNYSRRNRALSAEQARAIWTVLVEECGAREDDFDRFLYGHPGRDGGVSVEWRFGGHLGFGGKFYNEGHCWRVGCYPEDADPVTARRVLRANRRLQVLFEASWVDSPETDTPCEAGMFKACGEAPTRKCPCCALHLCRAHHHGMKQAQVEGREWTPKLA